MRCTLVANPAMLTGVDYPFRELIEKYFASIDNSKVETLKDLIEFNEKHAEQELPSGKYVIFSFKGLN
jgi:uncharacterized protein YqfB (UPF0267 family)